MENKRTDLCDTCKRQHETCLKAECNFKIKGINVIKCEKYEKEQMDLCDIRREMTPEDDLISALRFKIEEMLRAFDEYYERKK